MTEQDFLDLITPAHEYAKSEASRLYETVIENKHPGDDLGSEDLGFANGVEEGINRAIRIIRAEFEKRRAAK